MGFFLLVQGEGWAPLVAADRITATLAFDGRAAAVVCAPFRCEWRGSPVLALFIQGAGLPSAAITAVEVAIGGSLTPVSIMPALYQLSRAEASSIAVFSAFLPDGPKKDAILAWSTSSSGNVAFGEGARSIGTAGLDLAIPCGPAGLFAYGWIAAEGSAPLTLMVAWDGSPPSEPVPCVLLDRPDILDMVGAAFPRGAAVVGFAALAAGTPPPGAMVLVEVTDTLGGRHACRAHASALTGLEAAKEVLSFHTANARSPRRAMDEVFGPAAFAIHAAVRAAPCTVDQASFGSHGQADCSIVIPIYGSVDLMEAQLGLMSADPYFAACEIIYVLDDPRRRVEALSLAASCFARFGLSFHLLSSSRNMGFAWACNAGLRSAASDVVAFMNSDVFPGHPGALSSIVRRVRSNHAIGVLGARLLYADGSLQHDGMELGLPECPAGFRFPRHPGQGLRPPPPAGVVNVPAVTGALMVMRRAVAATLGGFDESFLIGDFEDHDLCMRARGLGFEVAVDQGAAFTHIERMSQGGGEPWRAGVTAYNAWAFDRRWFPNEVTA